MSWVVDPREREKVLALVASLVVVEPLPGETLESLLRRVYATYSAGAGEGTRPRVTP